MSCSANYELRCFRMMLRVQQFPSLYAVLEEHRVSCILGYQSVCLLKDLFQMFVPFKTFCFQNVAFQVCCWMSFVLFCFNESRSCQIYSLNLRCGKALVNLASKVSINYHWSSFPNSLEHEEISDIATDSCSIILFLGSSCDPPSQE